MGNPGRRGELQRAAQGVGRKNELCRGSRRGKRGSVRKANGCGRVTPRLLLNGGWNMVSVTFQVNGSEVVLHATEGDNLLEAARRANVAIDAPC